MQDFRQLKVWEKAHLLVLDVYTITSRFPADERFGLTSQLRRAAVSIPNNIAEGCGRSTDADFARFLQISLGSSSEVEYLLLLARDLSMLDEPTYTRLNGQVQEVKRMLAALTRTVRTI